MTQDARASLSRAAGVALVASGLEFLIVEAVAAAAWRHPAYSYVHYFISDLGSPQCGPFQGRDVCSPRHVVMNAGFVVQGLLFAAGGTVLSRFFAGRARKALLGLTVLQSVGVILVGVFHSSPAATADRTALLHGVGALLAIFAGNGAAIVAGRQWRREPGSRPLGSVSVLLGATGMLGAAVLFATWSLIPPGIPERVAVYTFTVWQLLVGGAILTGRARPIRQPPADPRPS